jgi:uncharacterized protein (TIGR00730 family)
MSTTRPTIAVFGSSTLKEHEPGWELARALGRELASGGAAVMTGGYGGAMAACSQGAHEAGGHVIGVTVDLFEPRGPANRWVRERLHTATLFERLETIIARADGYVTLPGSIGTLTELFLTWTLLSVHARTPAPLVLLGDPWEDWLRAHRGPALVPDPLFSFVETATSPADAARRVLEGVAATRRS